MSSWKERLENIKFSITTGDGKVFYPIWKTAEKSKDFNTSEYDFINVEGTFVDRKKPRGSRFPLVFYFQGEDNIDQCNVFEESANDNRIWTIEHPFYGVIKGQPTNLKRNDSNYNVTEVTVEFFESITDDYPLAKTSIVDATKSKVDELNDVCLDQLVENASPQTSDIGQVKESVIQSSAKFTPDTESFNSYKNTVKTAIKSADNLVLDAENSLRDIQKVINEPAEFVGSVKDKINGYLESYKILKASVTNLFDKYFFESQASSILAGMCLASVNPSDDDYIVRDDIVLINELISDTYDDYVTTLDGLHVSIYDVDSSFTANPLIQSNLNTLILSTLNNLFLLSFDARQERLFELTEDSNLIILTHRFLGLDPDDANIESFRKINKIKNQELYKIPKGRVIKYFV